MPTLFALLLVLAGLITAVPWASDWRDNATTGRYADDAVDDGDYFDETDLSFVTSIAAIGDSYSAGIGAGRRIGKTSPIRLAKDSCGINAPSDNCSAVRSSSES